MKKINLEAYYEYIDKLILLIQSFTEIKNLPTIIKMCRLKPTKHFSEKKALYNRVHYEWFDEFSSTLSFTKNKKPLIKLNNICLDVPEIACSDFYRCLPIKQTIKISKFALCKTFDEISIISLIGIDNYLRTYILLDDWVQISSLALSFKNLKNIANVIHKSSIKKNINMSCQREIAWLCSVPANDDLLNVLGNQFSVLK